jgi:hypothetical protein
MIKKWNAGFDRRPAFAIDHQLERNLRFLRNALDLRLANYHAAEFKQASGGDSKAIFKSAVEPQRQFRHRTTNLNEPNCALSCSTT